MSALTKIFVVLLIVCSLLLTAATVVFVNVNQTYKTAFESETARRERMQRERDGAVNDYQAQKARAEAVIAERNNLANSLDGQIKTLRANLDKANNEISELKAKGNVDQATIAHMTTGVKALQATLNDALARNKSLVADLDKVRAANFDLTGANTDLTKRLEEAERERRWLVEVNAQLKTDLTKAKDVLIEHHLPLDTARPAVHVADIKGVIKRVRVENGQTYATISVGIADKVVKDMKFTVIDQNTAEFLGYFTVDTVNQNEAFGRLEGPRVTLIKPDHQVVSQL